jgi:hypothetical protein
VRLLSGDTAAVSGFEETWATPYALSIYGQKVVPGGCGKDGDGYGDGRAISIGEVVTTQGQRWELQLKGGGVCVPACLPALLMLKRSSVCVGPFCCVAMGWDGMDGVAPVGAFISDENTYMLVTLNACDRENTLCEELGRSRCA